jgi:hypothetical protein
MFSRYKECIHYERMRVVCGVTQFMLHSWLLQFTLFHAICILQCGLHSLAMAKGSLWRTSTWIAERLWFENCRLFKNWITQHRALPKCNGTPEAQSLYRWKRTQHRRLDLNGKQQAALAEIKDVTNTFPGAFENSFELFGSSRVCLLVFGTDGVLKGSVEIGFETTAFHLKCFIASNYAKVPEHLVEIHTVHQKYGGYIKLEPSDKSLLDRGFRHGDHVLCVELPQNCESWVYTVGECDRCEIHTVLYLEWNGRRGEDPTFLEASDYACCRQCGGKPWKRHRKKRVNDVVEFILEHQEEKLQRKLSYRYAMEAKLLDARPSRLQLRYDFALKQKHQTFRCLGGEIPLHTI